MHKKRGTGTTVIITKINAKKLHYQKTLAESANYSWHRLIMDSQLQQSESFCENPLGLAVFSCGATPRLIGLDGKIPFFTGIKTTKYCSLLSPSTAQRIL